MATVIVNENNRKSRKYKVYSEEERRKVVAFKLQGHTVAQTSKMFGVSNGSIETWLIRYAKEFAKEVKMAAKVPMVKGWSPEKEILLTLLMEKHYNIKPQPNL